MITAGLLRRRPPLYDPEVTNGMILVGIENPNEEKMAVLEKALLVTPETTLKTIG
jgi:hypothetical protein